MQGGWPLRSLKGLVCPLPFARGASQQLRTETEGFLLPSAWLAPPGARVEAGLAVVPGSVHFFGAADREAQPQPRADCW